MMMQITRYIATYLCQHYTLMFLMNQTIKYILLFVFVVKFACIYTFLTYSVANNPWVSTFITASWAMIFILENMEQNRIIDNLEMDLEKSKQMTQITMLHKINELQMEVACLREKIRVKELKKHQRQAMLRFDSCHSL